MSASDKIELPLASWALWSGVLSIALSFMEFLIPFGIALAILAIITGHKSRKSYNKDQDKYKISSVRNATIGWICGIAGLCFSLAWGVWYLVKGLV